MRGRLATALKVAIGLALIAFLLVQVDFVQLTALARAGDPADLVMGMGAFVVALAVFQALRLHVLVRRHTGGLGRSYELFFVGALFNNLLPSNVGGDAVRLLYLRRMGDGGVGGPLALLVLHRLSGLAVLLAAAVCYAVLRPARMLSVVAGGQAQVEPATALVIVLATMVGAALAFLLMLRMPRVASRLRAVAGQAVAAVRALSVVDWWSLLTLTVCFQGARLLGFLYVARYLGQSADAFDLLFVLAAAAIAALLPISIAGLGVMEGSISYLLVAFGMAPAAAISAALAHRVALLLMALVGGFVYASARPVSR